MARLIEFSRRSTAQLQKILTFYDERNGSDVYSRRLLRELMAALHRVALMPTASSPQRDPMSASSILWVSLLFSATTRKR